MTTTGQQIEDAMQQAGLSRDNVHSMTGISYSRLNDILALPHIPDTATDEYEKLRNVLSLPELQLESYRHELLLFKSWTSGVLYEQTDEGAAFSKKHNANPVGVIERLAGNPNFRPTGAFTDLSISNDECILETKDVYRADNQYFIVPQRLDDSSKMRGGCWGIVYPGREFQAIGPFHQACAEIKTLIDNLPLSEFGTITIHILQSTSAFEMFPAQPKPEKTPEELEASRTQDEKRGRKFRLMAEKERRDANRAGKKVAQNGQ
ncbi:MAG: hypothetical protein QNJ29_09910 [Rhizobiaceae bacterium]|nr:hypothetical protein [Rhizobiaceae bacterium]